MVSRMYPPPVSPRTDSQPDTRAKTDSGRSGVAPPAAKTPPPTTSVPPLGAPSITDELARPSMDWPEIASAPTKGRIEGLASETVSIDPLDTANDWPTSNTSAPRVTPPMLNTPSPAAGSTAARSSVATIDPPAARPDRPGPVSVDDLALEPAARSALSPRFEFLPVAERADRKTSKVGRVAQGAMLLGLIAAIGAFIVMLPDGETSIEAAEPSDRVETADRPVATADMASSADDPQIEGSLGETGGFGNLTAFASPAPGTPADGGDGFATAVAGVVEQAPPADDTTTTTAFVEPTIPPESAWVDSGNGVMVPDVLLRIRFCESTNNYEAANTSSSARGAYQFLNGSWDWYGHAARTGVTEAHLATPAQQDESALLTLQSEGTSPWLASRACWANPDIDPRYATASPKPVTPTTTTTVAEDTTTTVDGTEEQTTTTEESVPETTMPDTETTTTEDTVPAITTTTVPEETTTSETVDDSSSTTVVN